MYLLVWLFSLPAAAEAIRFNEAYGAFTFETFQGYDFTTAGTPASQLSIEPFGPLCPNGVGCPGNGDGYFLGVSPSLSQRGVSFYPTYPTAWQPFEVSSFTIARLPGSPNGTVTVYGYPYSGGAIPEIMYVDVDSEYFTRVDLPPEWTELGELQIVGTGHVPIAFLIDDIEATFVEPPPPVPPWTSVVGCVFPDQPVATWPIQYLDSERYVFADIEDCRYIPGENGDYGWLSCGYDFDDEIAQNPAGPFDVALLGGDVTQSSQIECGELRAQGSVTTPDGATGDDELRFYGSSDFNVEFAALAPTRLSMSGELTSGGPGLNSAAQLWLSVSSTDGSGTVVYNEVVEQGMPGTRLIDDDVLLGPGTYRITLHTASSEGRHYGEFDVVFDFAEVTLAVPLHGVWLWAPAMIWLGWRRLKLAA